jgi:hypothetical protein
MFLVRKEKINLIFLSSRANNSGQSFFLLIFLTVCEHKFIISKAVRAHKLMFFFNIE